MKIFIEFWKAKEAWYHLSRIDRVNFFDQIGPVLADFVSKDAIVDAWGVNEDSSSNKANYDFFAITKLPSSELLESFQNVIEGSGWYNYFEQVNMSGQDLGAETVIRKMIDLKKVKVPIEKNL